MASSLRRVSTAALPALRRATATSHPFLPTAPCDGQRRLIPLQSPNDLCHVVRHMGGGPRNPERKGRFKARRKQTRTLLNEQEKTEKTKKKIQSTPSIDIVENLPVLNRPIPKNLRPYLPAIESYVVNEWMPRFPDGARLKKLQRDIRFRMNKKERPPEKIEQTALATVVGDFVRRGLVRVRKNAKNNVLVVIPPEAEGEKETVSEMDSESHE